MDADQSRLDEFDRDEFADATKKLWRPKGYTKEDFDRDWVQFQAEKRERAMQ